jgi:hypothetical protein
MMSKYLKIDGVEQPGQVDPKAGERAGKAFARGRARTDNPYSIEQQPFSRLAWDEAWRSAHRMKSEADMAFEEPADDLVQEIPPAPDED